MSKKKKHGFDELLHYMHLLEKGYSVWSIHRKFGINAEHLRRCWLDYQEVGVTALMKKDRRVLSREDRMQAVSEYRNNLLSLREVVTKYDISESAFYTWRKAYETNQLDLIGTRPKGRRPKDNMGRPKKKKPEEMTELERLRYENECLRTENALLKKVRALVEERNARLREIGQKPSKN